jgi:osmotically-inducible protein OsmY
MFRGLLKMILVLVVVVAAAFYLFGYWTGGSFQSAPAAEPDRTSRTVDVQAAREKGAEIGEKAAKAAVLVGESIEEGGLTAKIKAKMILDDLVKARAINVSTNGSTVTVSGTVHSQEERDRAIQLARETDGVTRVIDQLSLP